VKWSMLGHIATMHVHWLKHRVYNFQPRKSSAKRKTFQRRIFWLHLAAHLD